MLGFDHFEPVSTKSKGSAFVDHQPAPCSLVLNDSGKPMIGADIRTFT